MAIRPQNPTANRMIQWVAKAGGVRKYQLVKSDTGATKAAAAHEGATLLGVANETQLTTGGVCSIYPLKGTILEIDYNPASTKQSCTAANLGTQYDLISSDNEHFIDLDDTTGGFLILVGYDNYAKKAYCAVEDADCLLNV